MIRKKLFVCFLIGIVLACTNLNIGVAFSSPRGIVRIKPNKHTSKLQQLLSKPRGTVIEYCDLSDDNISKFPDLSAYTIHSLNLSNNQLDTLILEYLPQGVKSLDISDNRLSGFLYLYLNPKEKVLVEERIKLNNAFPLHELNVSHNQIRKISVGLGLRKLIASYNKLIYVNLNQTRVEYLDISHNPDLSNEVDFMPEGIDTIVREGIANDKKLVNKQMAHPIYD